MTKVESIEREVEKLTPEELTAFRTWFLEHDWQAWDRELERDVAAGRLDRLAAEALAEFERWAYPGFVDRLVFGIRRQPPDLFRTARVNGSRAPSVDDACCRSLR